MGRQGGRKAEMERIINEFLSKPSACCGAPLERVYDEGNVNWKCYVCSECKGDPAKRKQRQGERSR